MYLSVKPTFRLYDGVVIIRLHLILLECLPVPCCLISGNQRISDVSLRAIGTNCTNLEHLYIADCQRLTDLALKSLSTCKNLAVANFADCVRFVVSNYDESYICLIVY